MYTNLILYRNELKNKSIAKYKIIGITSELIFSKKIFRKNRELEKFLKDVFNIEFKDYVMKSRTMIVARVSREVFSCENNEVYRKQLIQFINVQIDIIKNDENIKEKKNEFNGWIK